eukprot:TRINITY_DN7535_c0_g1_i2.p1 TRINITY_DN7535_c0_g1~~TRINITY_DN7535_c0_g1_i2.p1  ORF type:complete len:1110 (+),score=208.72 TRINITY_DN7535_c0_g1_i2:323-3331(+)
MAAKLDGRLLGVGRGERGQLGMGGADRENKEKVKFSSALGDEQLLAVSAGDAHCVGLCRSGRVLAFGENKHGQLGLGDFVSSATPKLVPALQSRPVVQLCCGSAHTLARTATGLLWAWGCNEQGQLGLGDQKTRFRPEQVKAFRVSRCVDVAAGSRHSLAASERGLVFAWGAGGSGQLGSGGIADAEPYPRVVEALKEVGRCLLLACGHSHSLALVWNEDSERECLYSWGLGSSGQLALPRESLQDRKIAPLPQRVKLEPGLRVLQIACGPLAHHTFLLLAPAQPQPCEQQQLPPGSAQGARSNSLRTALDADELLGTLRKLALESTASSAQLKPLMKAVGSAFSSVSVLNASFRNVSKGLGPTDDCSGVDLLKVRRAYHTLVFELQSPDLTAILGRATLSICDELLKQRVPTDDPENLRVFLVLFENPLLLGDFRTSLFPGYHVALQRLIGAVNSLPKNSQRLLFGWLKHLPSEYFGRVVEVMQQYVTFTLTQPGQNRSDASAAVLMLQTLWDVNQEMDGILPEWCFHNAAISQSQDLQEHYRQWKQQQSLVFSYCKYPFLLDAEAKRRLLSFDAQVRMESTMQEIVAQSMREPLPMNVSFERMLHFHVRRRHLLADFCGQLWWRLKHKPACLGAPLAVIFVGEMGVDAGGLRKECLQLVLRQLCHHTSLFVELEELPGLLWFRPGDGSEINLQDVPMDGDDEENEEEAGVRLLYDPDWWHHLPEIAGAIIGLAAFNSIYLDLRLHPLIYRFLVQGCISTSFEDLRLMHPTLHRSLEILRKTDATSLGLTWSVRLPGAFADVDLSRQQASEPGSDGYAAAASPSSEVPPVRPGEVEQFIQAYAKAALVAGMQAEIEGFIKAATQVMVTGSAFSLCSADDLELLVCGVPYLGNFKELEASCSYCNGYTAESTTVQLLWQVVGGMSELWKRKFLLFCTGSDRVPILGLKALNFTVSLSSVDLDHLPTASTCINQLNLPPYYSMEMMRDRLYRALEHHEGFGFA